MVRILLDAEAKQDTTEQAILDRNTYDASENLVSKGSYSLADFLPFSSIHKTEVKPFDSMMVWDAS